MGWRVVSITSRYAARIRGPSGRSLCTRHRTANAPVRRIDTSMQTECGVVGEWALRTRTPRPTVITAVLSTQTWHHWGHIGSLSCLHKNQSSGLVPVLVFVTRTSDMSTPIMQLCTKCCPSAEVVIWTKNNTNANTLFRVRLIVTRLLFVINRGLLFPLLNHPPPPAHP